MLKIGVISGKLKLGSQIFFKSSYSIDNAAYSVNPIFFLRRYTNLINLFVSLFITNQKCFSFGRWLFKPLILALNWRMIKWKLKLWIYATPVFFFQIRISVDIFNVLIRRIRNLVDFFTLICDSRLLKDVVSILTINNIYTFGVTTYYSRLWSVTYPILGFSSVELNHIFFLVLSFLLYKISFSYFFFSSYYYYTVLNKLLLNS